MSMKEPRKRVVTDCGTVEDPRIADEGSQGGGGRNKVKWPRNDMPDTDTGVTIVDGSIVFPDGWQPMKTMSRDKRPSLREKDMPILEMMRHAIMQDEARSIWHAAQRFVHKAAGGGTRPSKVKRLVSRYKEHYGTLPKNHGA